ncbi:VWA domain-containing protein [Pseudoteredinibacter isoporae]|uniref:Uncharacterized protein (TIGR03503 family) n=1 Tax=Pseudoteredinibacter isoporae TaxID=570281 RepID=A0A7X0JW23_9GAMM|nr:vWA domain-containing protein [Pseudoteredinibacter isoporae]MBB6523317.1 uncharacterized protein (TIGR03503 family) [Pseudoteredinibacter isoporae]NHO88831.1 VWA domain-containing protein [Pseudoteredinibacter isoporae]NIB24461.1 VWA domain-containing protein [Pseudoteredinibacter isoporae]
MPQYRRLPKNRLSLLLWLALLLGFTSPAYAQATSETAESTPEAAVDAQAEDSVADVRLLIDVSGSMKSNDPANLRQPAIDLLVKLLPEGSKAGVWSFGRYVNMLVPHQVVGEDWKKTASSKAGEINSTGLFTNIGLALEKASYDHEQDPGNFDRHLILLTDGMVDIAKDPDTNQLEWQRITNDLLPRLQLAGYSIHTIALSDKADLGLLQQLSRETDGHSTVAHSADQLMQAFLQAFDKAAPAEQLPFDGESFLVDSSVEEFTALIFSAEPKQPTTLLAPDGSRYNARRLDSSVNWFAGDGYDLVTVKHPFEGEWSVHADVAEGSRITVVSDLSLKVKPLPNNINPGEMVDLSFSLRQEGSIITDPAFLSLLDINAQLTQQGEGRKQWNYKLYSAGAPTPENGIFERQLEDFAAQGQYVLRLEVDGKSFKRSFSHRFNSQAAFQAKLTEGENDEDQQGYWLTVSGATRALNLDTTTVEVNLIEQDGNQRPFMMELGSRNNWELFLPTMADGLYQFEMVVSGEYATGEHLRYNLPPLSLVLDGDSLVISDEPVIADKQSPAAMDDDSEAVETAPVSEESSHNWLLYGLLALGNLLVIALIYIGYRVFIMEKPEVDDEEEDEDEFIDVNAVVDDSDLPVEEAIAEVKETIAPKEEDTPQEDVEEKATAEEEPPAEEPAAEAEEETAAEAPEEEMATQDAPVEEEAPEPVSLENEMGDPDEANVGDDVLAMDDMDDDEAEAPAEDEAGEPPILDQAVEEPPVLNQAVEEPEASDSENKAAPNIDEEIDALLEQSNQASQEDEDWAAALQDELDGADGIASESPAEEAASDLSESLDLADEAVAEADLGELGGKKNADQG